MVRAYRVVAVVVVLIGIVAIVSDAPDLLTGRRAGLFEFPGTQAAIGLFFVAGGVLNLFNAALGRVAKGIRFTTLSIDFLAAAVFLRWSSLSDPNAGEYAAVGALVLLAMMAAAATHQRGARIP